MKQLPIPFKETQDIPHSHFHAFMVCNSADSWYKKQSFYALKSKILKKYGTESNFDLQTINRICNTCDGKGIFKSGWKLPETCWSCHGDGIFSTKKIVLKRWILNGALFHEPIGEFENDGLYIKINTNRIIEHYPVYRYEEFNGKIVNQITGIIKHEPLELNPTWSFYYLTWHYNREGFLSLISSDLNMYHTRTKNKLKKMLREHNPLKVFANHYKVPKQQIEQFDDLPF